MTPKTVEASTSQSERLRMLLACLFLAAVTFVAFSPLLKASFVDYDDQKYVTGSARVQAGLTWDNVAWAFTNVDFGFYYPLTWLSHMLDCQLYGLHAWGHHLTSMLIHIANALLLLIFLRRVTGAFWRSLAVAALFALHPEHVESVAWIAERKDVLSTFFLMLTFLAYERYVHKPGFWRYAAVFLLLLAGLMAKSMLVTAPLLLLLLDAWPLRRAEGDAGATGAALLSAEKWRILAHRWVPLVVEKIPLFTLSVLFGILTIYGQGKMGAVSSLQRLPLGMRAEGAIVGYASYLAKMAVPVNFAVLYPIPGNGWPWLDVASSALLLCAISILVWRLWRGRPYLVVGWLWFLVAIAPVSGLLQVGRQAYADRYTYVALIGVFVMVSWGLAEAARRVKALRPAIMGGTAVLVALSLSAATWHQCGYWRNGMTLFTHTLQAGGLDDDMLDALGFWLIAEGRAQEAIPILKRATILNSHSVNAWGNLGNAFRDVGKKGPAVACYRRVLELDPKDTKALHNLGDTLEREGKLSEALEVFRRRATLQPERADAQLDVGRLLAQAGHMEEAAETFRRAVSLAPRDAAAHYYLALALGHLGRIAEVSSEMHLALEAARQSGNQTLAREIKTRLSTLPAHARVPPNSEPTSP